MRTIILNGRKFSLSAPEERALRILKRNNFAAKKSEFVEGSTPRYQNTIVPKNRARQTDIGISETSRKYHRGSVREKMFFKNNPRCQWGIFGNPRRVNAILNKVKAQRELEIDANICKFWDRWRDHEIALREKG
jgi:hypothetical protein